jgi:hypothetical protein
LRVLLVVISWEKNDPGVLSLGSSALHVQECRL